MTFCMKSCLLQIFTNIFQVSCFNTFDGVIVKLFYNPLAPVFNDYMKEFDMNLYANVFWESVI